MLRPDVSRCGHLPSPGATLVYRSAWSRGGGGSKPQGLQRHDDAFKEACPNYRRDGGRWRLRLDAPTADDVRDVRVDNSRQSGGIRGASDRAGPAA